MRNAAHAGEYAPADAYKFLNVSQCKGPKVYETLKRAIDAAH